MKYGLDFMHSKSNLKKLLLMIDNMDGYRHEINYSK